MVFYFTGAGNSLYIAKQIKASPISIPQVIHDKVAAKMESQQA